MEFFHTVKVQAHNDGDIGRKVRAIQRIAAEPIDDPSQTQGPEPEPEPSPTSAPVPYFDIGEAIGKPGDVVELSVEGGCRFTMRGFDIAGGCGILPDVERSGYGLFKAVGVKLGAFLRNYLKAEDAIHDEPHHQHDHFWSGFHFVPWIPDRALPEEWWQYAIGFFSIDQERLIPETTIPSGTELFTLRVKILPETKPGEYLVTCKDEYYHRQSRLRRLDLLFSGEPSGGYTKIETFPGQITVR